VEKMSFFQKSDSGIALFGKMSILVYHYRKTFAFYKKSMKIA